jgi:DNA helicase-2/ATP-dependent DNA helicase PcrA
MREFTLESDGSAQPKNTDKILSTLNDKQRDAVTHQHGPLLIIAGAGSGKTRVLTYRIAYLLNEGLAYPSQILALTFTNKAAKEMRERIEKLIGDRAQRLWMGTFHSIFARILRYEAELLGYTSDFSIYDSEDSDRAIRLILKELNYDTKEIKPRMIRFKISSAKNQLITPDIYREKFIQSTMDDIAAKVYPIYLNRLKKSNALDFDDLLIKPIELFENHEDVLEKYQERFQHILIDEYQDTNHAQYKVTKLLASKYQNISVVGDDAQSIYSFRGADISNILNFEKDYPEAKKVALEQNYRSTRAILKAADSIIKNNEKQLEKNLWTQNEPGDTITVLQNYNDRDEANRVANHINEIRMRKGLSFSDIAVLYRTNYQSRLFEDALRRKGIAYQLVGGLSFYQRKEIKDVTAYLKILVNPDDEESLLRIINEPSRGIGNKTLDTLIKSARERSVSIWQILKNNDDIDVYKPARNQINAFVAIIEDVRDRLGSEPLVDTAKYLMKQTGYLQQFVQENTHESIGRRDNVMELFNALAYHEKSTQNATLSTFLQDISLVTDTDTYDEYKPAVTLMTVHASKGLEFPVVFIVGLEEELFPIGGRNGDEVDMEEERRLFYVAITRAKKELYFSHAKLRFKFGEEKPMLRSRFLDEVDPAVVRTETGSTIRQKGNRSRSASSVKKHGEFRVEYDQPVTSSSDKQNNTETSIQYDNLTYDSYKVGAKVSHQKFGKGKIISKEGFGDKTKVVVFFNNFGQKKLLLKFAKLNIIG